MGRYLYATVNDIESGVAQWSNHKKNDENGTPIWYHREKARYLHDLNTGATSNNDELQELRARLDHEIEMKMTALDKVHKMRDQMIALNVEHVNVVKTKDAEIKGLKAIVAKYESSGHGESQE